MKKMRIEKSLLFQDPVDKILTLKVTDGFTYKQEDEGIRTTGPLFIRGLYENDEQHKFQEILEMDVLAPNEKLSGQEFFLEIGEYQATPTEDGLDVLVMINIHGLVEEGTKPLQEEPQQPSSVVEQASTVQVMEEIEEVKKEVETVEEMEVKEEGTFIEDLFEDANNVYTSYRIVVAKATDTYETIAQRYQVEEANLRQVNANKAVQSKTLVILPYDKA